MAMIDYRCGKCRRAVFKYHDALCSRHLLRKRYTWVECSCLDEGVRETNCELRELVAGENRRGQEEEGGAVGPLHEEEAQDCKQSYYDFGGTPILLRVLQKILTVARVIADEDKLKFQEDQQVQPS